MGFNFQRGFNLIVNDEENLYLEIEEMKPPMMEEKAYDFTPGGGDQELDVPLGVTNKLELPFKLATQNPIVNSLYGQLPGVRTPFTARQYIVNEDDGREIEATIDIRARLMKREAENLKGGDKAGFDYMLGAITWYQEIFDGKVLHEMNRARGGWTVRNGVAVNSGRNNILGI
jgi:P2 family phage contractile tail tube protein